jgi:TrmH family RNA methyltransferase
MDIITSKENKLIKLAKSLHDKKARKENRLSFVEGFKLTEEAIKTGYARKVLCTEKEFEKVKKLNPPEIIVVSPEIIKHLSLQSSPDGIFTIIATHQLESKKEMFNFFGDFLVLDGLSDPGNVGTIFRTAAACGFKDVYLLNSVEAFAPKVLTASMGGNFKLNIFECDRKLFCQKVKEYWKTGNEPFVDIMQIDMNGENIFNFKRDTYKDEKYIKLFGEEVSTSYALVLGNEHNGISEEIKQLVKSTEINMVDKKTGEIKTYRETNKTYSIPMEKGTESLNVAVAAAIAMYQVANTWQKNKIKIDDGCKTNGGDNAKK